MGPGRHTLSKGGALYSRTILGVHVKDLTTRRVQFLTIPLPEPSSAHLRRTGIPGQPLASLVVPDYRPPAIMKGNKLPLVRPRAAVFVVRRPCGRAEPCHDV
jgi:hypothetical protein